MLFRSFCDGILIAQAYSPELNTPANRAFLAAFQQSKAGAGGARTGSQPTPPQLTAQAYTALQVVGEALRRLNQRLPLRTTPLPELRKALNAEILAGRYDTPLGEIRFRGDGEVIQRDFFVARMRMEPGGRSGRFELLPGPSP